MKKLREVLDQWAFDHWHLPWMGASVAVALGVAAFATVSKMGQERPTAAGWGLVVLVALGTLITWYLTNKLPRVPHRRVGIVLAVTCDNDTHDREVRADFIKTLRSLLEDGAEGQRFFVIDLPPRLATHVAKPTDAQRYLQSLRAHMVLFGTVRQRRIKKEDVHLLDFNGIVRHRQIPELLRKELSEQFTTVIPRGVVLPADASAFAFQATSQWAAVAARYIIGLAALVSGDGPYAESLLLDVEQRLATAGPDLFPLRGLEQKLPRYLQLLYEAWLHAVIRAYVSTRQESLLPDVDRLADKLLARDPQNHGAHHAKSMCHFLIRRDLARATESANNARSAEDVTWRYNLAFLEAYAGKLDSAEAHYKKAFRGPLLDVTVPVQCEEFIHLVLSSEPQATQLHYCSGLINYYAKKDFVAALRDFTAFLSTTVPIAFASQETTARALVQKLAHASASVPRN